MCLFGCLFDCVFVCVYTGQSGGTEVGADLAAKIRVKLEAEVEASRHPPKKNSGKVPVSEKQGQPNPNPNVSKTPPVPKRKSDTGKGTGMSGSGNEKNTGPIIGLTKGERKKLLLDDSISRIEKDRAIIEDRALKGKVPNRYALRSMAR